MKILFLSQRFLLPMDAGGKIRTGNILKHLRISNEIAVISNVESPVDDPYVHEMKKYCSSFIPVPWKEVKKHSKKFLIRLFFQMFSVYPVSVLNSYSRELQKAVDDTWRTGKYDVAICDFVQAALAFRNIPPVNAVLFQHNVESMIARRHMEQSGNAAEKMFWWIQWKKMFYFENWACKRFRKVIAVSEEDAIVFNKLYYIDSAVSIPTGVDVNYFFPMCDIPEEKNIISFCGSMDWLPNEDAVIFFLNDILPVIRKGSGKIIFNVVGKNPSPFLQRLTADYPEVTMTGWVDDIRPFLAKSTVVVVPIRIGGGTRMKIYEAMAMGKAVVSTSIGAEGLPVKDQENIFLEDTPHQFGETIINLLHDDEKRKIIGDAARDFVQRNFAWNKVAAEFEKICKCNG